jgi:hypothetical protein
MIDVKIAALEEAQRRDRQHHAEEWTKLKASLEESRIRIMEHLELAVAEWTSLASNVGRLAQAFDAQLVVCHRNHSNGKLPEGE